MLKLQADDVGVRKRKRYANANDFWEQPWGQLICEPTVNNPMSRHRKIFRRRFRLPFPVFQFLVKLCNDHNIFQSIYKTKIPTEAKVLACLRWLGRDDCADSIFESSSGIIGESTAYPIFQKFVKGIVTYIYPVFVQFPTGKELDKVMHTYSQLVLPGAVGSMDCTHVKWMACPKGERFGAVGKEGFPTLSFQVVVDHRKKVLHVSQWFLGATPDKTICKNDLFSLGVINGSLQDISYELYNAAGEKYKCKGAYVIVDGGYINSPALIDPDKHRLSRDQVLWSEWLESVRKDVENYFGILKARWRYFRNGISYRCRDLIEQAFKTVACLHNMILMHDDITGISTQVWENIDWSELDPNGPDDEFDDDEVDEINLATKKKRI